MPVADTPPLPPRPHYLRHLRLLALLAVVPATLLGPIVLRGAVFLPWMPVALAPLASEHPAEAAELARGANRVQADRLFPVLTDQIAMREELAQGRLPTWEPLFGLGVPLFAGSIAGAAYPPNWLGFLLPPEAAAAPAAMLTLFLAGLGAWLFLTRLGLSAQAALVGVLAYQLGGYALWNLMYFMKVDAALWLPWSLWAVEGLRAGRRWSGLALCASVAASLLAGFVTIGIFCLAFTAAYGLVRALAPHPALDPRFPAAEEPGPALAAGATLGGAASRRGARLAVRLAAFLALGVGMGAVQLLPAIEASRQSLRTERTSADLLSESLPVSTLLGAFVPDLFGAPTEGTPPGRLPVAWWLTPASEAAAAETANQLEWSLYAGAVCVLLALVGIVAAPRRAALPALGLVLVIAYAQGWWVVRWLYALPGLDIGSPARALAVAWFLWPWLAALGAESVARRLPRALETLVLASFAATVAAFLLWSSFEPAGWARSLEDTLLERYGAEHGQTLETIRARIPPEAGLAAGERLQRSFAQLLGATSSAFLAGLLALLLGRPRARFAGPSSVLAAALGVGFVAAFALAPPARWAFPSELREPSALAALGAVLAVCALCLTRRGRAHPGPELPLLAALAIEGVLAANGHVTGRPDVGLPAFPPSAALAAVGEAALDGRVLRYDPTPSGVADVENLARPNMLEPYGIADLTPYTVFTPRTLNELFEALDPRTRFRTGISSLRELSQVDHPLLDLLRVQAVLSREPLEHPRLTPVFASPGFHVYRRAGALPPARVVPAALYVPSEEAARAALLGGALDFRQRLLLIGAEPAGETPPPAFAPGEIELVERPSRDRFVVRVAGSSGGWLVMHEQFYPGWRARVNGVEAELVRADYTYRAVRLPPGDCLVETWYAPASVHWGLVLTVLSPIAAAFLSRRLSS